MTELRMMVQHSGEGHAITAESPTGLKLTFDGEDGTFGATPMQHLLAGLAACTLMDIAVILRKKRVAFSHLRAEAVGERPSEGHPKPFTSLKLSFRVEGNVPQKTFEDAVRLAFDKYCNIGATLRNAPAIAFEASVDPLQASSAVGS